MRLNIFALLLVFSAANLYAVEPTDSVLNISKALNDSGKVIIKQPAELTKRLNRVEEDQTSQDNDTPSTTVQTRSRSGYRVEVFADNKVQTAKAQAASKKRLLQARFPQYHVYLVFEAPYWRVRLGDFTNRSAADAAMSEVRQAFPSFSTDLRVVRSTINP